MTYMDIAVYSIIAIIIIVGLLSLKIHVNVRLHTMLAIGFVIQWDLGTTYIYIGPILISIHNIKKNKKQSTKER